MDAIKSPDGGRGFVIHTAHSSGEGGSLDNARGVSIYFPPLPPTYGELTFCAETRWNSFLFEYMNAVFRLPATAARLAELGALAPANTVAEFTAFRETQIAFFAEMVKSANIRIELVERPLAT